MGVAVPAALVQFLLTGFAFAALNHAFVTSDFSVRIVAEHSNSQMPVLFQVSATWDNHEGSMLLWVLILTIFGAMVAGFVRTALRNHLPTLRARLNHHHIQPAFRRMDRGLRIRAPHRRLNLSINRGALQYGPFLLRD